MSFPCTVNGTTWNLADFQNGQFHENLGPFLADCLADLIVRFMGTSTTSLSVGTGSKSLTIETGKAFRIGQTVQLTYPANPITPQMTGVITSYDSGTGALAVTVSHYTGSGTLASWIVTLGAHPYTATSVATLSEGGTGASTLPNAKLALKLDNPFTSKQPIREDFIGYFPTITTRNDSTNLNHLFAVVEGAGSVGVGGNVTGDMRQETKELGVLDGDHPGICVLKVSAVGDVAEIRIGRYVFSCLTPDDVVRILFFYPQDNTSTDKIQLSAGLRYSAGTDTHPGLGIVQPHDGVEVFGFDFSSVENGEQSFASTYALEAGYWYELHITTDGATDTVSVFKFDGARTLIDSDSQSAPTALRAAAYYPFVQLKKTAGGGARSVLVDYISWEPYHGYTR